MNNKYEMCLNCGSYQEITPFNTYNDELGKHTICDKCESSFDIN